MTKEEYGDFVLRYKGCGACFPMYHTLSRFEKIWFTAIQKDIAELEAKYYSVSEIAHHRGMCCISALRENRELEKENAELKEKLKPENCLKLLAKDGYVKFTSDNLIKAKELLKQWLQTSKASGCDNINIVTDTEQFLNSEVEK